MNPQKEKKPLLYIHIIYIWHNTPVHLKGRCAIRPRPHDMNRQECRTKRIDSVCAVTWIPVCARDGSVIKWGRGEGETLLIHVVWTQCALGLITAVRESCSQHR